MNGYLFLRYNASTLTYFAKFYVVPVFISSIGLFMNYKHSKIEWMFLENTENFDISGF